MLSIGTTSENNSMKKKLLIKTMKIIPYERHDKGNKNDSNYAITNLSKICHEV